MIYFTSNCLGHANNLSIASKDSSWRVTIVYNVLNALDLWVLFFEVVSLIFLAHWGIDFLVIPVELAFALLNVLIHKPEARLFATLLRTSLVA